MTRHRVSWRRTGTALVSSCVLMIGLLGPGEAQAAPQLKDCPAVPNLGQKLPPDKRFVPAFQELVGGFVNVAAYCDRETGLVWQRAPVSGTFSWANATLECHLLRVAGRMGWHLPLYRQLASLIDMNNNPALPTGHPFANVQPGRYWTATTAGGQQANAWYVDFFDPGAGKVGNIFKEAGRGGNVWCVRGGQAFDGNSHTTLH